MPKRLRRVLARGLSASPDGRFFPSMDALLAALERDPARRLRRGALAGAAALTLTEMKLGALAEARAAVEQSHAMNLRTFGEGYPAGEVLQTLGDIYLRLRQPERAVGALELARQSHRQHPDGPGDAAQTDALLARALWGAGRDRERARALAAEARRQLAGDEHKAEHLAELERWMRERRLR